MSTLDHPQVESSLEGFLNQVRPRLKSAFSRYRIPAQDTEDILRAGESTVEDFSEFALRRFCSWERIGIDKCCTWHSVLYV